MGKRFYCTSPPLSLSLSAGICTVCLSIYLSLTDKNEIQNTEIVAKWPNWKPPIRRLFRIS